MHATYDEGDFSFTFFISSSSSLQTSSGAGTHESEQKRPAVDFNCEWLSMSQREIWRKHEPCCKPRLKGWVKSSYFVSKKPYECQWSSLTRVQLSQGAGGVRDFECVSKSG